MIHLVGTLFLRVCIIDVVVTAGCTTDNPLQCFLYAYNSYCYPRGGAKEVNSILFVTYMCAKYHFL